MRSKLRVCKSVNVATVSSPPPKTPSAPKLVKVIPDRLSFVVSKASLNLIAIEGISLRLAPSLGVVPRTVGAKISSFKFKVRVLDKTVLPPVSVART